MTNTNEAPVVTIFAVLPPPVTGMTACTEKVAQSLASSCEIRRLNLSDGSAKIGGAFKVRKLLKAFFVALPRLLFGKAPKNSVLYMPLNANAAVLLNIAAVIIGRIRGYRIAIHHHAYSYLDKKQGLIALLNRILDENSLQLLLCPHMLNLMQSQYRVRSRCALVPSTIMLPASDNGADRSSESKERRLRRIGHLSNLTVSKGALATIETFAAVREMGHDVQLVLAGPVLETEVELAIEECRERFGNAFEYLGPLYGQDKDDFFNGIDVFLFPTKYRNEAQPIVLSESFQFGAPTITVQRSCIPSLMGKNTSWAIPMCKDYVSEAAKMIVQWIENPSDYNTARKDAFEQADLLRQDAQDALSALASWARHGEADNFIVEKT
jgi:glycosyltransferase involved in cell wall biosynthesis